jgi:acyl dehydratase
MSEDATLYFERIEPGMRTKTSGRTITEADLVNFVNFCGDDRPLYVDTVYCEKYSPTGERIVDPLLVYALYHSLIDTGAFNANIAKSSLGFLGTNDWEVHGDAAISDTIYGTLEITGKRQNKPDRGLVFLQISIHNQHGDLLQRGTHVAYVGCRSFFEKGDDNG